MARAHALAHVDGIVYSEQAEGVRAAHTAHSSLILCSSRAFTPLLSPFFSLWDDGCVTVTFALVRGKPPPPPLSRCSAALAIIDSASYIFCKIPAFLSVSQLLAVMAAVAAARVVALKCTLRALQQTAAPSAA